MSYYAKMSYSVFHVASFSNLRINAVESKNFIFKLSKHKLFLTWGSKSNINWKVHFLLLEIKKDCKILLIHYHI